MCGLPDDCNNAMLPRSAPSVPKPPVPQCDNMNRIAEDMDIMREVVSSGRRTTSEYLSLCLIGFGSIERRDALMRVVQWTLEPLLIYSSFVKDVATKEFEAILITKKQVTATAVEEWLGLFNMGVVCIQFDTYMQADMVTCISRIHHMGRHWYGSFKAKPAARVRRDFYKEHMRETAAKELQRVLAVTGMTVTPRNMLALHDRVSNLQAHVAYLERQLQHRRGTSDIAGEMESTSTPVVDVADPAARENLASAYRRLQARGEIHVLQHQTPPLVYDLTSAPQSPIPIAPASPLPASHSSPRQVDTELVPGPWRVPLVVPPQGFAFVARPPPSGVVTVGNMTVYLMHE